MFMRRRPLLRAAAVGGGAYALGSRHAQARQQEADQNERISDLESQPAAPQAAPAASPGVSSDTIERLEQLGKLHEQGVLTDDEFTSQKQRLLAG
jgi:Short C-terminal domain